MGEEGHNQTLQKIVAKPAVSVSLVLEMRITSLFYASTLLPLGLSTSVYRRDADFLSVRRKQQKDMSGKGGDPKEKYFRMHSLFS